jgi:pimeloyl-ACP methyl ester carboxylesterase
MIPSQSIEFHVGGAVLRGVLHLPGAAGMRVPTVIDPPGWLTVCCASAPNSISEPFHEGLVQAGFAVLSFDYRGFGASDGERGWIDPGHQIEDLLAAITFAETRDELDSERVGLFGMGALGAGNAIYAAAYDDRVRAVVVQSPVADGAAWLRDMRRRYEWHEFLGRVADDRRLRVLGHQGAKVDPRQEIMIASPERAASGREANDGRIGSDFYLGSVDKLTQYRPLDVIGRIRYCPILVVGVANDAVTPVDHAISLYEAAAPPKRLIIQRKVSHYESYRVNFSQLMVETTGWFARHLRDEPFIVRDEVVPGRAGGLTSPEIGEER